VTYRSAQDNLLSALADLSEVFNLVNTRIRSEAEARLGQTPVPANEVSVLVLLLHQPDLPVTEIARSTSLPTSTVQQAVRSLLRRGMAIVTPADDGGPEPSPTASTTTFRASSLGAAVREEARQTAAKHLRYALSGVTTADQGHLIDAGDAIAALSAALGFQNVHEIYRQDS